MAPQNNQSREGKLLGIMKDFGDKILFFSLVAVGMMASSLWSPPDTMGKKLTPILVTKEVLVEYVEDRLMQLERKDNLTEEEVVEINFIRQNRNNLQRLAEFYDMKVKDSIRGQDLGLEKRSEDKGSKEPPRETLQPGPLTADTSQRPGKEAPTDPNLTGTFEAEATSVSPQLDREIGEGEQHKRAEKVTVSKVESSTPLTSAALDHSEYEDRTELGLSHSLTPNGTSIQGENTQASLSRRPITNEEVKDFLAEYLRNYTKKDINSFLSLFSEKCVQNRRYRLEGIEKIYSYFFDQSQEVRYSLWNKDIRIYEEGALVFGRYYFHVAEVKARYRLGQILKRKGKHKIWEGNIRWILIRENEDLRILSIDYQHQKR